MSNEESLAGRTINDEIDALLRVSGDDRRYTVLCRRWGWPDGAIHTLDDIGASFGVTRERARQLEASSISRMQDIDIEVPTLLAAFETIRAGGGILSHASFVRRLCELGGTHPGVIEILPTLGEYHLVPVVCHLAELDTWVSVDGLREGLTATAVEGEWQPILLQAVKEARAGSGVVTLEPLARTLGISVEQVTQLLIGCTLPASVPERRVVLAETAGVETRNWARWQRAIRLMLAVTPEISLPSLWRGLRQHRFREERRDIARVRIDKSDLALLLQLWPMVTFEQGRARWHEPIHWSEVLSPTRQRMVELMEARGGEATAIEIEADVVQRGWSLGYLRFLAHSCYFVHTGPARYALRGRTDESHEYKPQWKGPVRIPDGRSWELRTVVAVRRDADGNLTCQFRLGEPLRWDAFKLPARIQILVGDGPRTVKLLTAKKLPGRVADTVEFIGRVVTGFRAPLEAMGVVAGDHIRLHFAPDVSAITVEHVAPDEAAAWDVPPNDPETAVIGDHRNSTVRRVRTYMREGHFSKAWRLPPPFAEVLKPGWVGLRTIPASPNDRVRVMSGTRVEGLGIWLTSIGAALGDWVSLTWDDERCTLVAEHLKSSPRLRELSLLTRERTAPEWSAWLPFTVYVIGTRREGSFDLAFAVPDISLPPAVSGVLPAIRRELRAPTTPEEQWRLGWPEFGYVEAARLTHVARAQAIALSESPTVNAVIQRGCPRGYVRRLLDRMLEAGSPWTAPVGPISSDEERADGIA